MASDVAQHHRIIFYKGPVCLAHGLKNNDDVTRHDLSILTVIEGASYYQALFRFEK